MKYNTVASFKDKLHSNRYSIHVKQSFFIFENDIFKFQIAFLDKVEIFFLCTDTFMMFKYNHLRTVPPNTDVFLQRL